MMLAGEADGMERAGTVEAATDQSSSSCVVGDGCLLAEHTEQGDPAGGIGADTAYGDIASTILLLALFVVAAIWAKRVQKKGQLQWNHDNDEWFDDWRRREDDWRHLQDLHRRFND